LIKIFRHVACEGPGLLAELLEQQHLAFEIISIDEGQLVPDSLSNVSGLVFLGGPMSANDDVAWIKAEMDLIKKAHLKNIPMLGFCLGSQLICKALGGEVFKGGEGQEIGWHAVNPVPGSVAQSWLGDMSEEIELFHWHGETYCLPKKATLIMSSKAYKNQAYVIGNTLGLQCHVEVSADMVREWSALYTGDLAQGGKWNQPASEICDDLENRITRLKTFARPLLEKWMQGVYKGNVQ